jgi:hypothetical protein
VLLHRMEAEQRAAKGAVGGLARLEVFGRRRAQTASAPTEAERREKLDHWLKRSQGVEVHSRAPGGLRAGREGGQRLLADAGRLALDEAVEKDKSNAIRQARQAAMRPSLSGV